MKTIFDERTTDELIRGIGMLNEHSKAQWGKMTGTGGFLRVYPVTTAMMASRLKKSISLLTSRLPSF
jgi:hypothetical protein